MYIMGWVATNSIRYNVITIGPSPSELEQNQGMIIYPLPQTSKTSVGNKLLFIRKSHNYRHLPSIPSITRQHGQIINKMPFHSAYAGYSCHNQSDNFVTISIFGAINETSTLGASQFQHHGNDLFGRFGSPNCQKTWTTGSYHLGGIILSQSKSLKQKTMKSSFKRVLQHLTSSGSSNLHIILI
jgi:hypothetical protein